MAKKLFGTDGVRGVAGEKLTAELAVALGRAAAAEARAERPQVLIVRDTRESGPMLESGLAAGIAQGGGDALIAGVLPTPAASILVRRLGLDLAVVVSASHNPWRDNGIKFFGRDGAKLPDDSEERIEASIADRCQGRPAISERSARSTARSTTTCASSPPRSSSTSPGLHVVLDCSNGATHRAAPAAFGRLGADVEVLCADPDGRNINEGCGSTHPERLAERVVASGADLGFAYDGDGDRVIAVDAGGEVRDGDELIALIAAHLSEAGSLGGGVAVTVMSNYGFHSAMEEAGIEVATTPVGDRHVSFELERRGWTLGGEQSGHVIWTGFAPTGDGIAASLLTARALGRPPARRRDPDDEAAADPRQRRGRRPRRGRGRGRPLGRGEAGGDGARGARPHPGAPVRAPSRSCA